MHALFYVTVYPVLWLLFWPLRAYQKKNHPEEYAANRPSQRRSSRVSVGLFNRSAGAQVTVTPEVVRPRQTVTATVTTDKPVDKVTSARLEWGYTNFYRYRWAGRADSAAAEMNDTWWMMGEVGTNAGSEKDTDDWVCVTRVDIPIAAGEFAGATSSFTVPSWAPGSSEVLARWSARLVVERGGRDVDARGEFKVVIGAADLQVIDEPHRRAQG